MNVAHVEGSALADRARGRGRVGGHRRLAYGEVRVGAAEMAIGYESLLDVAPARRRLFEQAVAAADVDPESVLAVRITACGIEVDALDFDDACWPERTRFLTAAELSARARCT